MSKMEAHEKVFPFVCNNTECGHEFDLRDFVEVIQLWGFIYMIKGEHMLLGLTCPHCRKTTARKYPILATDCSVDTFTRQIVPLESFVPFSTKILLENGLIHEDANKVNDQNDSFRLPCGFESIAEYQKNVADEYPFYIAEDNIEDLIQIENVKKFRAIPRIVLNYSAYKEWDRLFLYFNPKNEVPTMPYGSINYDLFQACTWRYEKLLGSKYGNPKSRYLKLVTNEFDSEDFEDFDYEGSEEENIYPKYINQIVKEYASFRNVIDFEISHKVKFANKYANLLYYREGSAFKQKERSAKDAAEFDDMPPIGIDEHGMPIYAATNEDSTQPTIISATVDLKKESLLITPESQNLNRSESKPKVMRHSTKIKLKCRKIATDLWADDPSIRIREMAFRNEITKHCETKKGDLYSENTIKDWIKDLCPNPRPGRPKKHKK